LETEIQKLTEKKKAVVLVIVFVLLIFFCHSIFTRYVETYGVYTKCTIVGSKERRASNLLTITYFFNLTEYTASCKSYLTKSALGNQYFIKILPSNPRIFILYEKNPVPHCLTDVKVPKNGWKYIPECP